ncbi:MAG: DUF333 domain-containing protein [Candidatus Pacebacteria bacterium]|nr:DUF333 domain-containing protein [Candidatus Paceibacterota bacterium]
MKKISLFLIVLSLFACSFVFAEGTVNLDATKTLNVASPTVLPTTPLYFLKEIGRNIQTFMTMDPVKKAELKLKFANEKLAEADKVSQTSDTEAIDKALNNYEKGVESLKQYVEVLKKDNPNNQKLLEGLAENSVNHQQILNKIAESGVREKAEAIKERAVGAMANGTLDLASPQKVKEAIEKAVTNNSETASDKADILNNIVEKVPDAAKKVLVPVQNTVINEGITNATGEERAKLEQSLNRLKETNAYKELVVEDLANKIVLGNEILKDLDIPEADLAKIKEFAQNIVSNGSINYGQAISGINTLNISTETQKKITQFIRENISGTKEANQNSATPAVPIAKSGTATQPATPSTSVGMANPASTFCVKNGYKVEIRKNADGSEYGVCIFTDGKECEEWKFFRKECGKEYIK